MSGDLNSMNVAYYHHADTTGCVNDLLVGLALFSGHAKSTIAWARIAPFIETCKFNQVEPHARFKVTRDMLEAGHPLSSSYLTMTTLLQLKRQAITVSN